MKKKERQQTCPSKLALAFPRFFTVTMTRMTAWSTNGFLAITSSESVLTNNFGCCLNWSLFSFIRDGIIPHDSPSVGKVDTWSQRVVSQTGIQWRCCLISFSRIVCRGRHASLFPLMMLFRSLRWHSLYTNVLVLNESCNQFVFVTLISFVPNLYDDNDFL